MIQENHHKSASRPAVRGAVAGTFWADDMGQWEQRIAGGGERRPALAGSGLQITRVLQIG